MKNNPVQQPKKMYTSINIEIIKDNIKLIIC